MRRSRHIWLTILTVFMAVFAFTFLMGKIKNSNTMAASLSGFDPGYIISDYQMGNYQSMSEAEIQQFLTAKNPCSNTNYSYYLSLSANKKYTWHWKDGHFVCLSEERFGDGETIGSGQTAAHIIWQAAQDYRINPQVLIVLLQKETSLITDPVPNSGDYRKATGYGCPDTAPCSAQYYGFKNQIKKAAELFRAVLDGGWTNFPLGNNYIQYNPNASCGGSVVNIRSLATSALYRYTPYQPNAGAIAAGYGTATCGAYGNRNFYLYFEDWFGGITATQRSVRIPDGDYYIQSGADKTKVVDVSNGDSNDGANIQLYHMNETNAQKWTITYNSSTDDYSIINKVSQKALDVTGASMESGANIQLWSRNNTCAQRWKIIGSYYDELKFVSACSGKAIDITGGKYIDGNNLQIWVDNNTVAQRWKIVPIEVVPDGIYNIASSLNTAELIDIAGGASTAANGTNIQIWGKNNTSAQRWYIKRDADGYYTITNLQISRRVDAEGGQSNNGTNVQMWSKNNSCAQKWRILKKDNNYTFISACSQKVVDLYGASTKSGTNIQLYSANNTGAQKWRLTVAKTVKNGEYNIVSTLADGKVLDLAGNLSDNGTNIQLYGSNTTSAQKWKVTYDSKTDSYEILNSGNGKAVDVQSARRDNGANIQLWSRNNTCAQKWDIVETSGGYVFYSVCSGLVMDVTAGKALNGTNIQLFQYNGTKAQKWVLR